MGVKCFASKSHPHPNPLTPKGYEGGGRGEENLGVLEPWWLKYTGLLRHFIPRNDGREKLCGSSCLRGKKPFSGFPEQVGE